VSGPPAELSAAIAVAMSHAEDTDGRYDASQLVIAVERLLPRVVLAGGEDRSSALDLLTLDALLTSAMEAASNDAAECEATATALLDALGRSGAAE
jgi:hypothetical protein